jgi:hypothetical protein
MPACVPDQRGPPRPPGAGGSRRKQRLLRGRRAVRACRRRGNLRSWWAAAGNASASAPRCSSGSPSGCAQEASRASPTSCSPRTRKRSGCSSGSGATRHAAGPEARFEIDLSDGDDPGPTPARASARGGRRPAGPGARAATERAARRWVARRSGIPHTSLLPLAGLASCRSERGELDHGGAPRRCCPLRVRRGRRRGRPAASPRARRRRGPCP